MMKNIFKGFIIGIGKIIPGVSGSMLAILLGVYERALAIIANIRWIKRADLSFIFSLVIGIFIGISVFSRGVKWFLDVFYLPTMLLFIGLIISGVRQFVNELSVDEKAFNLKQKVKHMLILILAFAFSYWITKLGAGWLSLGKNFDIETGSFSDFGLFYCLGLIEAFSSIVPGISGTAIFMSLGCYDLLLSFFVNIFNISYWRFGLAFLLGVLTGVSALAKIITFLLKRYKVITYMVILGFMLSAIWLMMVIAFDTTLFFKDAPSILDIGFGILASLFWILIGNFIGKKINVLLSND